MILSSCLIVGWATPPSPPAAAALTTPHFHIPPLPDLGWNPADCNAVEPLEQGMVQPEGEWAPQEVVAEGTDCPLYGEALLFYHTVVHIPLSQLLVNVQYGAVDHLHLLGQNGPSPLFEALDCRMKGREKLGVYKSGSPQRARFTL